MRWRIHNFHRWFFRYLNQEQCNNRKCGLMLELTWDLMILLWTYRMFPSWQLEISHFMTSIHLIRCDPIATFQYPSFQLTEWSKQFHLYRQC
jgi:hypothetical protein